MVTLAPEPFASRGTCFVAACQIPFGGKTVVFGGDFRQVLPVVRKGSRAQIIDTSLRRSYLWDCMRHLKLVRNMRAHSDPWFAEYLLRIGDGKEETNGDGDIHLPDEICVPCTGKDTDLDTLIENVFPNLGANMSDPNYITSRAILSTRNDCVDRVNLKMRRRCRSPSRQRKGGRRRGRTGGQRATRRAGHGGLRDVPAS